MGHSPLNSVVDYTKAKLPKENLILFDKHLSKSHCKDSVYAMHDLMYPQNSPLEI